MKIYRPGRTIRPLFLWTLIACGIGLAVEMEALELPKGSTERWLAQVGFAACMILGPCAFIAHLVRRHYVSVAVDPEQGLLLSGRRFIPWEGIDRVEHKAAPFKGGGNLLDGFDREDAKSWAWIGWMGEGCLIVLALLLIGALFYYIFLPVFFLLSPWHSRVILHLDGGDKIVYRDLKDDDEFASIVLERISARTP